MNKLEVQQARLNSLAENNKRAVAVILEGRDSAGKTGTIRELTHFLPPRLFSVVMTKKPSKHTMTHWFEFWGDKMPNVGQIVFYDRSWYSRAMVQAVNEWCTPSQYKRFMKKVLFWEENQNVTFIKVWLSISEQEQNARLNNRRVDPLRYWKMSPNDERALTCYDQMTIKKETVFNNCGPWHSINYDRKLTGRLEFITTLNNLLEEI